MPRREWIICQLLDFMLSFIPQTIWDKEHLNYIATAAARECLRGEPALHLHKFITLLHLAGVIPGALGRKGQAGDRSTG